MTDQPIPSGVKTLIEALAGHPHGLTPPELLEAVRERLPQAQPAQVDGQLRRAVELGLLQEADGRITLTVEPAAEEGEPRVVDADEPLRGRFVSFDIEAVVRPSEQEPYTQQRIYQIGGVRFGKDAGWVEAGPQFTVWLEMSEDEELLLHDPDAIASYQAQKQPRGQALAAFRAWLEGAEMIVAYNGHAHDFPVLYEEYGRAGERAPYTWPAKGRERPLLVDGYLLALSLWPTPSGQHRLKQLVERLQIAAEDLHWHDATDDSEMLRRILEEGAAARLAEMSEPLRELVTSAAAGSPAWQMLDHLHGAPPAREFGAREVAQILEHATRDSSKKLLRPEPPPPPDPDHDPPEELLPPPPPPRLSIPARLRDRLGRVSLGRLIRAAKQGQDVRPRDSQERMLEQMRGWVADGRSALVEAPTGTGKSYALLAQAIDWLAADSTNKVVIATFTKQLQAQLADDIDKISAAGYPELAGVSDLVKGSVNRLSLRALVVAVSDLTIADPRRRAVGRADFSTEHRYRELACYLLLRFMSEGTLVEEWLSRSVDPVDVPAFFDGYLRRTPASASRLALYLRSLSQADAGEWPAGRGGAARLTMTVSESLAQRRLIIANHALLLAHLDEFEDAGERTLLIVDEAHELENAATAALGHEVDTLAVRQAAAAARGYIADQPADPSRVRGAADDLEQWWEDGDLGSAALLAFSTQPADPLGRVTLRTVTVESPFQGEVDGHELSTFAYHLGRMGNWLDRLTQAVRNTPDPANPYELDRLMILRSRLGELSRNTHRVLADIHDMITEARAEEAARTAAQPSTSEDNGATAEDTETVDVDGDPQQLALVLDGEEPPEQPAADDDADADAGAGEGDVTTLLPRIGNRVVWASELSQYDPTRQGEYRFQVTASPIQLDREPDWQRFLTGFPRVYYVSATLRVSGGWTFIRRRLGLAPDQVAEIHLPSPFDYQRQARLVCLSDFPSWSEHDTHAIATIAHQLSGYADQVIDDDRHGALVLTTSRAAAGGISERLARLRGERSQDYRLIPAVVEGNQPAVNSFQKAGGILVGTRGLWQGVDVADPERLALVWINKLPFANFADPIIACRIELERQQAEANGHPDPEQAASEDYYLPLAAIALRQAVGRLVRSTDHRGCVVISDRKLAGPSKLRASYRRVFLESLDDGLLVADPETGEAAGGNVCDTMTAWRRMLSFYAEAGIIPAERAVALLDEPDALAELVELPEIRALGRAQISTEQWAAVSGEEAERLLVERCTHVGALLSGRDGFTLKERQVEAISAVARRDDLLGVLPTGYGKSYCFQLPALVLPGTTIIVSPLVSLMTDQALELNRAIGGMVRALVAPMRESNSRTGKAEVAEQLEGSHDHRIKLVYLSPERLAQRQFQELLRRGVTCGAVTRIVIDEAHTMVQWGDDFRPAIRRAENFLRRLRSEQPQLRLTALTATANQPVRAGLRQTLFGLDGDADPAGYCFVTQNPLRPELAIYRRKLDRRLGGRPSVAGLVERVADRLDGHAIFYCLTVRQTDEVYNHLSDYLGSKTDVMRYHGRLPDTVKVGVANRFRDAPAHGEEGYRPMLVVATSAFGLGIDRADIRSVFCVSPPADLAALYQQIGRAGRDRAAAPEAPGAYTAGLAATYMRADRVLTFMTQERADPSLYVRAAALILNETSGSLICRAIADDLIADDVAAKRLSDDDALEPETADRYLTLVVRVLAELDRLGAVEDRGDYPQTVSIKPGGVDAPTQIAELRDAILTRIGTGSAVDVAALADSLPAKLSEHGDAAATWTTLLDLHTGGYLDVSQRPNRAQMSAVTIHTKEPPAQLMGMLGPHRRQVQADLATLRGFFASDQCASRLFGDYFHVSDLPPGTCETADCRCSAHWASYTGHEPMPKLLDAFLETDLRPRAHTTSGRKRAQDQLDRLVVQLLRNERRGLGENLIRAVLAGDDHYYSFAEKRRKPLWPPLLASAVRGRRPGIRRDDLHASLDRLVADGTLQRISAVRYRLTRYVLEDEARAAREAAKTAGAVGAP